MEEGIDNKIPHNFFGHDLLTPKTHGHTNTNNDV